MADCARVLMSMGLGATLLSTGCTDADLGEGGLDGTMSSLGDGDATDQGDGDGNGGDGDGDATATGDPAVCDPPSPYMGGWDIGCCQQDVAPQNGWSPGGVHVGTIMPDWTFQTDQFGEPVRLYDFCHEAIYFEYVALW